MQDQIRGMCDRFAAAGFDALVPDLYNGIVVPYHDTDAANKEMSSVNFVDATEQTVRGAAPYLKRNGGKIGLTGFCMGGAVTIIGACRIPELDPRFDARPHDAVLYRAADRVLQPADSRPLQRDFGAPTVAYVALVGSAYVLPNLPGTPPSAFNPTSIFK